jgi:hypothetical protein
MFREKELAKNGWKKQAAYDEPRLSELVKLYEEIGMEVHLEPFHPDENHSCTDCMKESPEKYMTIYTRETD